MLLRWTGPALSARASVWLSRRKLSVVPPVVHGRAALQRSSGSPGPEWRRWRRSGSGMCSPELSHRMVWVDLEMTGLDIDKDQIIEMACIITDADLNVVAEGPNLIIKQPDELLDGMSDWCQEHHGQSGLIQAVRDSKISLHQAEYEFLSFVRQHTPPGQCPLAGNSVHADKRFLDKYMPQFMFHLHHRIIDVSTVKELSRPVPRRGPSPSLCFLLLQGRCEVLFQEMEFLCGTALLLSQNQAQFSSCGPSVVVLQKLHST